MYYQNRVKAQYTQTEPSLADQAGARETDLNVIVGRMIPGGMVPGLKGPGIYADWTGVPTDLRGLFEQGRSLIQKRGELPEQLRDIPLDALMRLTNEQLAAIMAPPKQTNEPKPTNEPPKEQP